MGKGASIFLCLAVGILVTIGLVILTSASAKWDSSETQYSFLFAQAKWLAIGLAGMTFLALIDYRVLRKFAWPMFGFTLVLLSLCYVPGIGDESGGERRWIIIPGLSRFQPSEPAKLVIMVALASWLARYQAEVRSLKKGFLIPGVILGIPLMLILFEKDMGTTAGLGLAGLIVLFVAGTRPILLLGVVLIVALGGKMMVEQDPQRKSRIVAFTDLEEHKQGAGWQQWMALRAFGNGGPEGLGLGNGVVKQMNLPEHHTDFIYPVIGEELGVFASMGIILCFVGIVLTGIGISLYAPDFFGKLLGIGITCSIVIPAMMNIGVTTGSLPNTGLPLPFVSYGGSNLVFTLAMVGVLLSILRQSNVTDLTEIPTVKNKSYEVRL